MQFDSIRHRLIALIGFCLIGMLALVATQTTNVNRLIDVQTDTTLLLELENEILQLRRHEKDFLLRLDLEYSTQFNDRVLSFKSRLNELSDVFESYQLPEQQLLQIQESLALYETLFSSLVQLQIDIGLDEDSGQQGKFRRSIHLLEANLTTNNQTEKSLLLLQMRRNEKDFLQRNDIRYVEEADILYGQLRGQLSASDELKNLQLLDDYYSSFTALVVSNQRMGLSPNEGIQGAFRSAAHDLEEQLAQLSSRLNPLISQREQDVKVYGIVIALLTVSILLSLIVRNFIKLQKTLSNFLQFFHQSKREYQLLDAKKMGFSEFRTLAEVANEMVEARREMELELKETKDKLAIHQASQTTSQ